MAHAGFVYVCGIGTEFGPVRKKAMELLLKPGDKLDHAGKQWTVTEVGEDNEGQIVLHLKAGEELSVIKEADLPKKYKTMKDSTNS